MLEYVDQRINLYLNSAHLLVMALDTPAAQNMVITAVGKDLNFIVIKDVEVNAIPCTRFLTSFQWAHSR